jgi:hypothetical protein
MLAACVFLYKVEKTDYIILISLIIVFGAVFTISKIELRSSEVKISKAYLWGLLVINEVIAFKQIVSLTSKTYDIDTHEDAEIFADGIFSYIVLAFFKPKVRWLTTKIYYKNKGIEKDIEIRMSREDFKTVEREIRLR